MTSRDVPTLRPLNVQALTGSRVWEPHVEWFANRSNASLIEGQAVSRAIQNGAFGGKLAPELKADPTYDLLFYGGATITDLTVCCIFVEGPNAWPPSEQGKIEDALKLALQDEGLNGIVRQYFDGDITTSFSQSLTISNDVPEYHTADIVALARKAYDSGLLTGDYTSTAFCFFLPPGVRLFDDQGHDSLHGLGGFHGSVSIPRPDGSGNDTLYGAIGVYSQMLADGTMNGVVGFDENWKNVAATFYHEINEVRTNRDITLAVWPSIKGVYGWYRQPFGEIGDIPIFEAKPLGLDYRSVMKEIPLAADQSQTVPVQLLYSNAVHGPAVP